MKIAILASYGRSLVTFRGALLETMVKKGHDVVACAPNIPLEVHSQLDRLGVRLLRIPMSRTGTNPVSDFRTLVSLIKLLREENPDRLLAYTVKPVVYGGLAARMSRGTETYSMITGLGYAFMGNDRWRQRAVAAVVRHLYRAAISGSAGVFFQNPDDLGEFRRRGLVSDDTRTFLVNGSGVDLEFYEPASLPPEPSFLLIARLIGDKGVREYVEAARLVRQRHPEARFRLAGWLDSNPSAIREAELDRWVSEGDVEYLGPLDDVRPALRQARVYVLPSYREGTPRTVLEAMSMGRPVVTTDAPGCRETVRDGVNGFLVPVRDSEALARAMIRFLETPNLAEEMGREARRVAQEKYDVHKVNKVILAAMGL